MSRICQVTGKRPITGNNVSHAKNRNSRVILYCDPFFLYFEHSIFLFHCYAFYCYAFHLLPHIKQLIDLLHEANHKSYLIISGPTDSDVANERREIAENYLQTLGVKDTPVIYGDYGYKSARDALKKWLKKHDL